MSIYTECGEAARMLLDDPSLSNSRELGVFTELDVIFLAGHHAGGYSPDMMKVAQREASQALGAMFRARQVVRFGPVKLPGVEDLDYLRIDTKIAYASPDGPEVIQTPNGNFPRMFIQDDPITRQGRRLGANRDDRRPWDEQDILERGPSRAATAEQREILRLTAENESLRRRLKEAEAELHRLREHTAQAITRSEVEQLFEERIGRTRRAG